MSGVDGMREDMEPRWVTLERLGTGIFDLLVVGGGIVGCRVALDASRAGLRVALVDAGDFAGATSSASAGLLHGGLRYLRRGGFGLVRAACRERNLIASRVAPHLARPLPFVAAHERGTGRGPELAAGLGLYAALGGRGWPLPRPLSRRGAAGLVPPLGTVNGVRPTGVFHEALVDDSRLTLATARAAVGSGAVAVNYLGVADLRVVADGTSEALLSGEEAEILLRARTVVNATGPWTDAVRRMEDRDCRPLTRLSRGVHVVLDAGEGWNGALGVLLEGGDHLYAVPRDGTLLLGTTDEEYVGDPGDVSATSGDVLSLLDRASHLLPDAVPKAVLCAFAGLRVLPRGTGATAAAPRGHLVSVGRGGMVSVAGGKLTTHRRASLDALRLLPSGVRPRMLRPDSSPLPGAPAPGKRNPTPPEDPILRHLTRVYGADAGMVLSHAVRAPGALDRIAAGGPDVWAQVHHAALGEWAVTVEDVVRRRTSLSVRGLDTAEVRKDIADVLEHLRGSRVLPATPG